MEIRHSYAAGVMQKDLAIRYGISRYQIGNITRGEAWSHLPLVARRMKLAGVPS